MYLRSCPYEQKMLQKAQLRLVSTVLLLSCLSLDSMALYPNACLDGATPGTFMTSLLNSNYSYYTPPRMFTGNKTHVDLSVFIERISSMDVILNSFEASLYLREKWIDQRLCFHNTDEDFLLFHHINIFDSIWRPNLFIPNSKATPSPSYFIRIHRNGTVHVSRRFDLVVSCVMELSRYPMDAQNCSMQVESYSETTEKLSLSWDGEKGLSYSDTIRMPHYVIRGCDLETCQANYSTGIFGCVQAKLRFERSYGYDLSQEFVPSACTACVSWMSFWIPPEAVPARVTLGLTTMLAIITETSGVRNRLPSVAYIKAIDVWLMGCAAFVIAALLEYTIVSFFMVKHNYSSLQMMDSFLGGPPITNGSIRKPSKEVSYQKKTDSPYRQKNGKPDYQEKEVVAVPDSRMRKRINKAGGLAKYIDRTSRFAFPLAFAIFNIVFWLFYAT